MAVGSGPPRAEVVDAATVRFAGDAADGLAVAGDRFAAAAEAVGLWVATRPLPPAEIRADPGTLAAVGGCQVRAATADPLGPGDAADVLVALNPAALRVHLPGLAAGGLLVVDPDAFTAADLAKARYPADPLAAAQAAGFRVVRVPVGRLAREAVRDVGLSPRERDRCKSWYAAGLAAGAFELPPDPTLRWVRERFAGRNPAAAAANARAVRAGHQVAAAAGVLPVRYRFRPPPQAAGPVRRVTGTDALAFGLAAAADKAGRKLVYAAAPAAPAVGLLERLVGLARFGPTAVQAEDDPTAAAIAVGASGGGAVGAVGGTGAALGRMADALGLAAAAELPLVVVQVQPAGHADLLEAAAGRGGRAPPVVLAPATPADGFAAGFDAVRLAVRLSAPVVVLVDAHLLADAGPWPVPATADLPAVGGPPGPGRDHLLARPRPRPGALGRDHVLTGLGRDDDTGEVTDDPADLDRLARLRADKVANAARLMPPAEAAGPADADLLVVGWGGTYAAIAGGVDRAARAGRRVARTHLRLLHPPPAHLGDLLARFPKVLVPEAGGQLAAVLAARFGVRAEPFAGSFAPLTAAAVEAAVHRALG